MEKHIILGVHVFNREQKAGDIQKLFTEYGCNIKTRIGLHDVHENFCSSTGIIILEMTGEEVKADELSQKLNAVAGLEVKKLVFEE